MKLHKTGKMVRILSMMLVVAIMMSVCLVQAFAGSASTTLQGYTARAEVGVYGNGAAYGEVTFDVSAGLTIKITGTYATNLSYMDPYEFTANGGANHYQATVVAETPRYSYYVDEIAGTATVGYNGSTVYLYPRY